MQKIIALFLLTIVLGACQSPVSFPLTPTRAPASDTPTVAPPPTTFAPSRGGDFRAARARDAISFHPYLTTDATSRVYQDKVFASGLWLRDPQTLQPIPGMAESWTVSEDGKTYTFSLRRDLKWSDGTPLTAHDFVWTFVQAAKPEHEYPYIEGLANIASYIAKDDTTLEITLKEATCTALLNVDVITPLPQHIWSKLDWSDPSKNPEINFPSVVSGPYKLKEWKRGDYITFVRNDLYYRGAPYFDSYTIRIVPEASKQFQMLQAGEVDTAPVAPADFAKARQIAHLKLYEWTPAAPEWEFIGLNLRRPFLKNSVVRQALAYAVPRDAIAAQVFHNLAQPTYSIFPPTMSVFAPDAPRYAYNLDTAKSLLQKAGYKLDASGKLVDSTNKAVPKLRILYNINNKTREQVGAVLQAQLQTLGIESELLYADFTTYVNYLRQEPFDFDLFLLGWRTPIEPYLSFQMWSEINIPHLNLSAYVNPEVERLFAQTNKPPCSSDARHQAFAQIQKIIATDVPYIFLVYHIGYAFVHQRVVPNPPSPLGIDYFPEQWFMSHR